MFPYGFGKTADAVIPEGMAEPVVHLLKIIDITDKKCVFLLLLFYQLFLDRIEQEYRVLRSTGYGRNKDSAGAGVANQTAEDSVQSPSQTN